MANLQKSSLSTKDRQFISHVEIDFAPDTNYFCQRAFGCAGISRACVLQFLYSLQFGKLYFLFFIAKVVMVIFFQNGAPANPDAHCDNTNSIYEWTEFGESRLASLFDHE